MFIHAGIMKSGFSDPILQLMCQTQLDSTSPTMWSKWLKIVWQTNKLSWNESYALSLDIAELAVKTEI